MIIIVATFETDGDYSVDNEATGLASPPDDDYAHSGAFLCADTDEAAAVLLRIVQGVKDKGEYFGGVYIDCIFSWLTSSVNEALRLLRNASETLRFGWCATMGGNYEGTILFMQKITDERGEPKKPILRNSDKFCCELNVRPTCGHIVEGVESMENFKFCPGCGQRIDWEGASKDALGG